MSSELEQKIYRFYQSSTFYHVLFWSFMLVFLVVLNRSHDVLHLVLAKNFLNILFFIAIAYVNILYLIPEILSKSKTILYVLALVGIAILMTPVKIALFYLLHNDDSFSQLYYVENYHLPFLELILVAVASSIYKLFTDIIFHQNKTRELEKQNLTSELKFLKSQIDPHFFFNTLNSLYALTLKKSDQAPDTVLKLSNMMRYMLYECNDRTVPLQKEIDYIKNYIDLESIRHGNDFKVHLDIEGDAEGKEIMPLIFSPFVENSFKHGMRTQSENNYVNISLKIKDDHLFFNIENSNSPEESKHGVGGIGLENVKRRLKLVYPEKHMLRIKQDNDNYLVELYLKLLNTYHVV